MGQALGLFAKRQDVDAQIAVKDGINVYGVAGDGAGQSAGKLGGLMALSNGRYALTYLIEPETHRVADFFGFAGNQTESMINEVGLIVFDREGISTRHKLRDKIRKDEQGNVTENVEFVHSALYGGNVLVAWKLADTEAYWVQIVDAEGQEVLAAEQLPAGIIFTEHDGFVTMQNGDVMWTAADNQNLKLFRLPASP